MAQPDRKPRPQFSQPVRQIMSMLIALGLAVAGAVMALPRVLPVFEANPYLNGFIGFVFVIGVVACFWQVTQLIGSVRWIEEFAGGAPANGNAPPQLLAPLASLLRSRGAHMQLSASSTRSILDSVATRIDEEREITRYIVNLLIFLGLLGTFYGLATTVPAVVDTIRSLAPQEGEDRHGGIRPPDDRARIAAGRHGRGLRLVASGPGRIADRRPAGALCRARAEPVLPRARGMAVLDHPRRILLGRGGRRRIPTR